MRYGGWQTGDEQKKKSLLFLDEIQKKEKVLNGILFGVIC